MQTRKRAVEISSWCSVEPVVLSERKRISVGPTSDLTTEKKKRSSAQPVRIEMAGAHDVASAWSFCDSEGLFANENRKPFARRIAVSGVFGFVIPVCKPRQPGIR